MKRHMQRGIAFILPLTLLLSGCTAGENAVETIAESRGQTETAVTPSASVPFEFEVNPESFELSFQTGEELIPISTGGTQRAVSDYQEDGETIRWRYPEEEISVSVTPEADYLSVELISEKEGDNAFTWPEISSDDYYIPFGEGKHIPADNAVWQEYLDQKQFTVIEQLSMPFWISAAGEYSVLYIMENPYRTELEFSADSGISFVVSHEYPQLTSNKTNRFRIYLTDSDPVSAAKLYRSYVMEKGDFLSLEEKAEQNPNIRKLYGAPHIYLWGDFLISSEDIHWPEFRKNLDSPVMNYLLSLSEHADNGDEFKTVMQELRKQDYVAEYQKNVICSYISQQLRKKEFFDVSVFTKRNEVLDTLLKDGYDELNETEQTQVGKQALAANLPGVFEDPELWMAQSTDQLLRDMKDSGIEQAWVGLNDWEQGYAKPEVVQAGNELGYLIGSYDSYHSIHEPSKEQWSTAKFEDTSLYEDATVTDQNGQKVSGFNNVGRKLNPVLSLPSVMQRMEQIMSNDLPFNSWFIDCDATGEIYDDYSPSHITTQEEDAAARLVRMSYIRDQYNLVVGSEGGHDFAASTIAFAHGIELRTFSWMDPDMKSNKDSEYYIGRYYSPTGGVAEHFANRIPVKENLYTIFVDPAYDIPLFKLVYNDSLVTTYHWDWSTFKIKGATQDRMLREVLYNVPPLYHLDGVEWDTYKEDIISHQKVWSPFSKQAVVQEMTDFEYLAEDGTVQKTVYGENLAAVANFSDDAYSYQAQGKVVEIPAHSVLIEQDGEQTVYTPSISEMNQ